MDGTGQGIDSALIYSAKSYFRESRMKTVQTININAMDKEIIIPVSEINKFMDFLDPNETVMITYTGESYTIIAPANVIDSYLEWTD